MQFIKEQIKSFFPKIPLRLQMAALPSTPLIVFFHGVGKEQPYIKNLYPSQSEAGFEKIIDELLTRFKPLEDLSITGIAAAKSNRFIVTFDDGLRSAYEIAVPILERKGIPAIFFLNPDFMDGRNCFYRFEASLLCETLKSASVQQAEKVTSLLSARRYPAAEAFSAVKAVRYADRGIYREIAEILEMDMDGFFEQERPYFTAAEATDLLSRGFYLGAHSCDHPRYGDISPQEQVRQTLDSTQQIQQRFNLSYRYFAFPFSDEDIDQDFYTQTRPGVDLYFTTGGWRKAERQQGIYHRVWLDTVSSAIDELKSEWDPL
jgi:peptidoglycan/xylan/chitin deacetylase (PgdA/CDA1 family)